LAYIRSWVITESTALPKTSKSLLVFLRLSELKVIIEVIDNEDEDGLGFDVKNLKLEIYKRFGGILETSSPPGSYIDVIVLDQYAPGKRMRVHMVFIFICAHFSQTDLTSRPSTRRTAP
jgi:hypothetical protein